MLHMLLHREAFTWGLIIFMGCPSSLENHLPTSWCGDCPRGWASAQGKAPCRHFLSSFCLGDGDINIFSEKLQLAFRVVKFALLQYLCSEGIACRFLLPNWKFFARFKIYAHYFWKSLLDRRLLTRFAGWVVVATVIECWCKQQCIY